jgi:hypothetical protein
MAWPLRLLLIAAGLVTAAAAGADDSSKPERMLSIAETLKATGK